MLSLSGGPGKYEKGDDGMASEEHECVRERRLQLKIVKIAVIKLTVKYNTNLLAMQQLLVKFSFIYLSFVRWHSGLGRYAVKQNRIVRD